MNGPLLISLLPPERLEEAAKAPPDPAVSFVVAILLLAGILLSLWMRRPDR